MKLNRWMPITQPPKIGTKVTLICDDSGDEFDGYYSELGFTHPNGMKIKKPFSYYKLRDCEIRNKELFGHYQDSDESYLEWVEQQAEQRRQEDEY